jgi:dihydroneopterin aldolase
MTAIWIRLRDIPLHAYHGVFPREKEVGTDFFLDVELLIDATDAVERDRLETTIDYASIHDEAIVFSMEQRYDLLEKWVYELAHHLMSTHSSVHESIIRVRKPGTAVEGALPWIEVEYHKKRMA